jgi:hypothetical protein
MYKSFPRGNDLSCRIHGCVSREIKTCVSKFGLRTKYNMAIPAKPKVYTTVDDINYHLSNVFALYPTLYASPSDLSFHLQVIAPLIKNSREFCEAIKNKKIAIGASTGTGGFSAAGPLNIRSDHIDRRPMASGISFAPDGSWTTYFMETFSKTSHTVVPLSIRSLDSGGGTGIISTDPVHEGIVGALASHLFDIGVAPSFMKYLGLYTCDDSYKVETEGSTTKSVVSAKPYFLFEKSDIEMYNFLGGELDDERKVSDVFAQTTPYDFMIWATQLAHTQFVGKYYFGITHIDGHTKNIMLTNVKNTKRAIKWADRPITPLMYGKTNLSEAEYYEYVMPFKVNSRGTIVDDNDPSGMKAKILLENNGLLPKIIDFGLTVANLTESVVANAQNIVFANEPEIYDKPVMGFSAITQDTKGDLDYNYVNLNIAYRIARAIQIPGVGYQDRNTHYTDLWKGLLPFWRATLPPQFDPGKINTGGVVIQAKKLDGSDMSGKIFGEFNDNRGSWGGYHMRARPVGTTTDIQQPLKKIWNYMLKFPLSNGSSRFTVVLGVPGPTGTIQISRDNTSYLGTIISGPKVVVPYYSDPRLSNLQKFIKYNFVLWRACIPKGKFLTQDQIDSIARETDPALKGKNSAEFCSIVGKELVKYDPNNKKPLSFFKNLVASKSPIWDASTGMLRPNISREMLEDSGFQRSRTRHTQLFTLRFNPGEVKMSLLAEHENLKFISDQRLTNYKPPPDVGQYPGGDSRGYMKMVNVHLIYITPPVSKNMGGFGITVENGKDLYKASKERLQEYTSGVSVNGGYFIVQGNYADPLNYWLTGLGSRTQGRPIGYFYSNLTSEFNGTLLPIPRAYQENFATVYITPSGTLKMERSLTFQERHETRTEIVLYALTGRPHPTNYAVQRKVIKMEPDPSGSGFLIPVLNLFNKSFGYKAAFECGPILIWDGKIEFTRKKMDTSEFHIDSFKDISSPTLPDGTPNIIAHGMETYKVVSSAANSKMYFNDPDESNFPYGQRHSNSLMIHNVLCETKDGDTLFVFIEGRGFDAVGLDRAQLAELISRFNVKNAVSLDGGFSANAVLKRPNIDEPGYYWLLNDPDKRSLSSTIHFGEV